MAVSKNYLNRFKDVLRDHSLRLTSQRMAILKDIMENDGHRECDDIYSSLKRKHIKISRATIYRTLDILTKAGFVWKMDIGDGRYRYERRLDQSHHDHMICLECGTILEFVDQEIEKLQQELTRKHGFQLTSHTHQLFGICKDCQ